MTPMAPVNNSSLSKRAKRALETRRRMRNSAHELFVSQGYPGTTMAEIADLAGVAVQTLYYTFQTKGKLLIEVIEVVAAGEDDVVPVPERPWFREMMSTPDPQRVLALMVEHGTAIYERVAHLWPVITTAMADPDVAVYWDGVGAGRRQAQQHQAARLDEIGGLKPELTVERAADLLVLLAGHAPYRTLIEEAGWPVLDYKAWLFTTLVTQLLEETSITEEHIADLSFADLV